jgi:peptide/nickel transport system permease protein
MDESLRRAGTPAAAARRRGRHPARDALRRLARSRSAVVGSLLLLAIGLAVVLAPALSPYNPIKTNQRAPLEAPSAAHLMGTDRFGRDILSRVLWGGRLSLSVGVVAVGIAACSGVVLGLIAGYYGGRTDMMIMRLVDLLLAFPGILLALAIIATLGGSLVNLMIAVGIAAIPDYVRITRGTVLSLMEQEFVLAARVVGCRDHAIIFRHILPNVTAPLTVLATLGIAGAIITGSALSFLGLGVRPPAPEWGNMLAEGREFLEHAWWVAFFPGLAIMLAVFSINLLGDGLRDALDPRLRA